MIVLGAGKKFSSVRFGNIDGELAVSRSTRMISMNKNIIDRKNGRPNGVTARNK